MKPERWRQIDQLLEEVLDRPAGERDAFLDEACRDDEALRMKVASLLASHEKSADFIEEPAISHAAELLADTSVRAMIGRSLGRYEITSFLGAGGMGEVFLANDTQLKRPVALKLLPTEFIGNEHSLRRFGLEAQAVSSLNHPNIITIYEVGEAEDLRFIATEYVAGVTLRRRMSEESIEVDEALEITIQIAVALSAAHGAGVVHSDVKPENVMVREDGIVKVLDFGIAKFTKAHTGGRKAIDEDGVTPSTDDRGPVIGTVPYMSPEQVRGLAVDARSDVWSLGVMLYEMVTGALPFRGSTTAETLSAILEQALPAPPLQAAPARLRGVIEKALQKDRHERYASAKELVGELRELKRQLDLQVALIHSSGHSSDAGLGAGGALVNKAPPAEAEVILKNYWRLGLAFMLLLAAAAVGAIYLRGANRADSKTAVRSDALKPVALTSYAGNESFPALSPDGTRVAFTWDGPGEDNYDIYVQGVASGSQPVRLTTDRAVDRCPAWSPDGKYLAFTRNSNIFIVEAQGESGVERQVGEGSGAQISFYPDGKSLAISAAADRGGAAASPSAVYRLDIESGTKHKVTAPPENSGGDFNPVFSPDGRWMAFCRWLGDAAGDIYVLPVDGGDGGGNEPRRLTTDGRIIRGLTWSEDGSAIVFSANRANRHELWRVAVTGGEPERLPMPSDASFWPSISRRGSRLVYETRYSDVNVWRVEKPGAKGTVAAAVKLMNSSRAESSPQYSPDGTRIAFVLDRSGYNEVWLCDADGSRPVQLTKIESSSTGSPKWSPDGKWIVFDSRPDEQADIFTIGVDGEGLRRLTDARAADVVPSWSEDGRFVYFGSNRGGDFQIWRVPAEGGEAQQVTKEGGFAPVASADGRHIYYAKGNGRPGGGASPSRAAKRCQSLRHSKTGCGATGALGARHLLRRSAGRSFRHGCDA